MNELVRPEDLKPHPWNPNKHPKEQIDALVAFILSSGWRHSAVVSKLSGCLVAGHARRLAAEILGCRVPVEYQDFPTGASEQSFLYADNRLAELASMDMRLLKVGLNELQGLGVDISTLGFKSLEDSTKEVPIKQREEGIYNLNEGAVFSSSNCWGIPDLRLDMCASADLAPSFTWLFQGPFEGGLVPVNMAKIGKDFTGATLAFYNYDDKFESIWEDALGYIQRFGDWNFSSVIEPDFSTWVEDPFVVQLWARYKSQWVARYWQEVGIKIIPSISWAGDRSSEFLLAGVPKGAPVLSVQLRTLPNPDWKVKKVRWLNEVLEKIEPEKLLLYGENHRAWSEHLLVHGKTEYIWLEDYYNGRKRLTGRK
jgi:hypothetical protein